MNVGGMCHVRDETGWSWWHVMTPDGTLACATRRDGVVWVIVRGVLVFCPGCRAALDDPRHEPMMMTLPARDFIHHTIPVVDVSTGGGPAGDVVRVSKGYAPLCRRYEALWDVHEQDLIGTRVVNCLECLVTPGL